MLFDGTLIESPGIRKHKLPYVGARQPLWRAVSLALTPPLFYTHFIIISPLHSQLRSSSRTWVAPRSFVRSLCIGGIILILAFRVGNEFVEQRRRGDDAKSGFRLAPGSYSRRLMCDVVDDLIEMRMGLLPFGASLLVLLNERVCEKQKSIKNALGSL